MRARGAEVVATNRSTFDVGRPDARLELPDGVVVLHSIPVRAMPTLAPMLRDRAARVVYLSTTGVYGAALEVDEHTPPAPRTPREQARVDEENDVLAGPWSALVLRPAAIYGPGRGVHVSMAEGRHQVRGDGSNFISRIHVDDLATITAQALVGSVSGAYPVADEEPCQAREITDFCARLLGLLPPRPTDGLPDTDTRSANRRVDGGAIRKLLGIELRYPTYREGIPASLTPLSAASTSEPDRW
jgi:nucleoside-diphosphate-sugar epimerase